jgi:FlaA1/EpsC-like NDP-sugar epimerase
MWLNVVASGAATVVCAGFVVVYHLHAPWWRSATGRHLMAVGAALTLLFAYTVGISVWPDGCPAAVLRCIRTVVVVAIAGLMVQRTRMVLRAQHEPRDRSTV